MLFYYRLSLDRKFGGGHSPHQSVSFLYVFSFYFPPHFLFLCALSLFFYSLFLSSSLPFFLVVVTPFIVKTSWKTKQKSKQNHKTNGLKAHTIQLLAALPSVGNGKRQAPLYSLAPRLSQSLGNSKPVVLLFLLPSPHPRLLSPMTILHLCLTSRTTVPHRLLFHWLNVAFV